MAPAMRVSTGNVMVSVKAWLSMMLIPFMPTMVKAGKEILVNSRLVAILKPPVLVRFGQPKVVKALE